METVIALRRGNPICTYEGPSLTGERMVSNILLIGGSGFVSGTLARTALARGHSVWTVTRGRRPAVQGAQCLIADRKDEAAFVKAVRKTDVQWDLVVDCIGYRPEDTLQDIEILSDRARHLVFISTDFTFDPMHRRLPQNEETEYYATSSYGDGDLGTPGAPNDPCP